MPKLWEWGLNIVAGLLAIYTLALELWVHSACLTLLTITLLYFTLEPMLMKKELIKISVFDRISR